MLLQARPDFREEDFQQIEEIIPDMHGTMPWFRCRRTNLVKSHLTYWQPFRRVVYLVRDGRAATFSNWQFQRDEGKHNLTFAEYLHSPRWPSTWSDHVTGWVAAPEVELVIRYEDIVKDPCAQLKAICETIGWQVDGERISRIVENSSRDRMKSMEQSAGVRLHRVGLGGNSWREAFDFDLEQQFISDLSPKATEFICGDFQP
jgi:hypothetical protein